jgi:hypothetical protein
MAIVIDRALQSYPPGTYSITRTIPAHQAVVNRLKITLSDPGVWPLGRVADIRLIGPDGNGAGGFSVDGGVVLDRQGVPRTERTAEFVQRNGAGVIIPFPNGDYTLEFDVLQTATSAVTVERF